MNTYQGKSPARVDAMPLPLLAYLRPLVRNCAGRLPAPPMVLNADDVKGDVNRDKIRGAAMLAM